MTTAASAENVTSSETAAAVADPRQLGIDDFSSYALVIDARTPGEFEEDHIPGAINLPVVDNAEFADVGTRYVSDAHAAYLVGAAYASSNLATHIRTHISKYRTGDRLLVYCFRGGKRSRVWADTLRNIGFDVTTLKGGWKEYRRWVIRSLDSLPARFDFRVLSSLTGCGKTRLLHALESQGQQVLDLEGLASHRGSLLGAVPGCPQPSQKTFDSRLLTRLRTFDPQRPVWVEAESKKVGNVQLPTALYEAMRRCRPIHLSAPVRERVRLLREDYPQFAAQPLAMVAKLEPLRAEVGGEAYLRWKSLAEQGLVDELFEQVLLAHYDPSYNRARQRSPYAVADDRMQVTLPGLSQADLTAAAEHLTRRFGSRSAGLVTAT